MLSSAGATILAAAYLLPLGYLVWSLFYGERAPANPWQATGLEWQTPRRRRPRISCDTPVVTEGPYEYPPPDKARWLMAAAGVTHEFQYASAAHQSQTAIAGMWLFLATEVLFFGGLILRLDLFAAFQSGGLRCRVPRDRARGSGRSTRPS